MPKDAALQSIQAHRATDERVARAFGAAFPGRLCVIDAQVPILAEHVWVSSLSDRASVVITHFTVHARSVPYVDVR